MPTLELSVEQAVELLNQLPLQNKIMVLSALNADRDRWWDQRLVEGEKHFRRLCAERGLDWDTMSEDERERFIDDLMHEDR